MNQVVGGGVTSDFDPERNGHGVDAALYERSG